jgi:hypothetical protein
MSAGLGPSPSQLEADSPASGAVPESPSDPDLIVTTPLAPQTEPLAEAILDSFITAAPPEPPDEALLPTEAETQTSADPYAPVPPPELVLAETLLAGTLLAGRAASRAIGLTPKVVVDAPNTLSSLPPSTSRHHAGVTNSTQEEQEQHPLPPIPPMETPQRLSHSRSRNSTLPVPQPLDLPGVVRRPSAVHFEGLEPEWPPPIDSNEVRPL